jgi:hypothetical protein
MKSERRNRLLRGVLAIKVVVTIAVWGLPALMGPRALFAMFGIPFPEDPIFVRLFGAVVTALALAYWYAWKDPVQNVAIVKFGVLDNGLATVTIITVALTTGIASSYFWASCGLTAFFCVAFLVLMPRRVQYTTT